MNAEQMIKTIKAHVGPIEVPVMTGCDVWHVVVQKADLIQNIERAGHNPFMVLWTEAAVLNGRSVKLMRLDTK